MERVISISLSQLAYHSAEYHSTKKFAFVKTHTLPTHRCHPDTLPFTGIFVLSKLIVKQNFKASFPFQNVDLVGKERARLSRDLYRNNLDLYRSVPNLITKNKWCTVSNHLSRRFPTILGEAFSLNRCSSTLLIIVFYSWLLYSW